jgi:hypothetical protein
MVVLCYGKMRFFGDVEDYNIVLYLESLPRGLLVGVTAVFIFNERDVCEYIKKSFK